jgi:hypothetical protein
MASSLAVAAGSSLAPSALWAVQGADPCLWVGLAAVFAGLACGQALRAFVRIRESPSLAAQRRARRLARAIALFSLVILSMVGLLVVADKAAILEPGGGIPRILLYWAAGLAFISLLAGFRPLVLGLPLASLCLAAFGLLFLCLEGWLPLRSSNGPAEVARLLPYQVGQGSFRGQLEMPERDSVPVVQDLGLASASVGLRVESLSFTGPLRLAANFAAMGMGRALGPSFLPSSDFHRVVGLSSTGGELRFDSPRHATLLDRIIPLPAGGGPAPGSAPESASILFGAAKRTRCTSEAVTLVTLEPVLFSIGADGRVVVGKR